MQDWENTEITALAVFEKDTSYKKKSMKKLVLQNVSYFHQGVQNWFSKQEMEFSQQEMELFILFPGL